MIESAVVVVRMKTGEDILGILCGESDGKIKLEWPHFAQLSADYSSLALLPYCALSDERYYEISLAETTFVVVAREDVSAKFFHAIQSALEEAVQPADSDPADLLTWSHLSTNTKH